jgi:hypothetical protein
MTFYVTDYTAKHQGDSSDLSALVAKQYAYHDDHNPYLGNLRESHRLLLFCLVHAINHEQQFAAPMVISYLMGWGDTYVSHYYVSIYWSPFFLLLTDMYPKLSKTHVGYVSYFFPTWFTLIFHFRNDPSTVEEECHQDDFNGEGSPHNKCGVDEDDENVSGFLEIIYSVAEIHVDRIKGR